MWRVFNSILSLFSENFVKKNTIIKMIIALALVDRASAYGPNVLGLIPGKGMFLGCRLRPGVGPG